MDVTGELFSLCPWTVGWRVARVGQPLSWPVEDLPHAFELERARRELHTCGDIEKLRVLSLKMLDLLEGQRRWFNQMVSQGWLAR